jgi:hypothetical protein
VRRRRVVLPAVAAAVAATSIDALKLFLPRLGRLGLHAVSVSDLLRLDPPDTAELPNGAGGCNSSWHR